MKKTLTTILLTTILSLGTTFANAGIIITNIADQDAKDSGDPCKQADEKSLTGIIITNLTGIIITNFTGIIITNAVDTTPVNCGIIITN